MSKVHDYLSTACHHDLHGRCRRFCKFCSVECGCDCHKESVTIKQPDDARALEEARKLMLEKMHIVGAGHFQEEIRSVADAILAAERRGEERTARRCVEMMKEAGGRARLLAEACGSERRVATAKVMKVAHVFGLAEDAIRREFKLD